MSWKPHNKLRLLELNINWIFFSGITKNIKKALNS